MYELLGILHVSATDHATGRSQEVTIQSSSGLKKEEIEAMMREAEEFKNQDEAAKELISTKNDAETLIYRCEQQLVDFKVSFHLPADRRRRFHCVQDKLSSHETSKMQALIADLRANADSSDGTAIRVTLKSLQECSWDLSRRYYKSSGSSKDSFSDSTSASD